MESSLLGKTCHLKKKILGYGSRWKYFAHGKYRHQMLSNQSMKQEWINALQIKQYENPTD